MPDRVKVLQVSASDITVSKLLLPLVDRLSEDGYSVSAACADGRFARELSGKGYVVHTLPMTRSVAPLAIMRSTWALYRLIRRERYDVVHVHTPVAAAVGRIAATMAGTPIVLYTAHGFYFHDGMAPWAARITRCAERVLGHMTDFLFTQSAEDAQTAILEKISSAQKVTWISNGVDLDRFAPVDSAEAERQMYGLEPHERVVGFVGRLVREKGIMELLDAMSLASEQIPGLVLLVAGDNATAGDRDQATQKIIDGYLKSRDLRFRIVFTGFIDNVESMMRAIDVFTLPSYREGMPRSIIEAMATGKPVVATDIRGCREEVLDGQTGYLVPAGDSASLARRLVNVLASPGRARRMGVLGRARAEAYFDEKDVLDREIAAYSRILRERLPAAANHIAQISDWRQRQPAQTDSVNSDHPTIS